MIRYRNATLTDLNKILDWAAYEGWNPGLDDAEVFFQTDPQGFFVAVDQSNDPLAAISVVNHTDSFAFLGLYIVLPKYRGQGHGFGLWQHALQHAGNRTVGLDGVEDQQANYATSGFLYAGGTTRFSGDVQGVHTPDIQPATSQDIPALIAAEAAASGVAKPAYLQGWLTATEQRVTLTSKADNSINGFCTVRACRSGAKIGPLMADDTETAQRLITHAATVFEGPVILDVPETATALTGLCIWLGLEPGFKTARMYRGPVETVHHPTFAVVSLELG